MEAEADSDVADAAPLVVVLRLHCRRPRCDKGCAKYASTDAVIVVVVDIAMKDATTRRETNRFDRVMMAFERSLFFVFSIAGVVNARSIREGALCKCSRRN